MNKFERAFIDGFMKAATEGELRSAYEIASQKGTPAAAAGAGTPLQTAAEKVNARLGPPPPSLPTVAPAAAAGGGAEAAASKSGLLESLMGKAKGAGKAIDSAGSAAANKLGVMAGRNPKTSIAALLATLLGGAGLGVGLNQGDKASSIPTSTGPMQGPPMPPPGAPAGNDWLAALKKNMGDNKLAWGAGLGSAGLLGGAGLAHAMSPDKEKEQSNAVQIPA